jgi:hypothetical protein
MMTIVWCYCYFSHGGRYCPTATADWGFHH